MSAPAVSSRVLFVDDDDTFRSLMCAELSRRGHTVTPAATGAAGIAAAAVGATDVIVLDMRLPDMDGIEVLARLGELEQSAPVIVLTGHGTVDTAIQAIRLGAHDYLQKPCPIEELEIAIEKAREHRVLVARQRVLQDGYSAPDARARMIGHCPAFERLQDAIDRIAPTHAATLVLGETGVGKELVAAQLHTRSPRSDAPFVVVDCAALHDELLLSELFGHEKGAFTGAARKKHGLFEVAHGGSIFLDEIGELSPEVQANLLRVLETGCFRRVGGTQQVEVDVRVVSATNRDLRGAASAGTFREDLYFRLANLTIEVPPLRERRADVPLLVEHFTARFNRRLGRTCRFGPDALEALEAHAWPGNVRELLHVVEQAMVLARGEVLGVDDLPEGVVRPVVEGGTDRSARDTLSLREVERRHLLSVLASVGGNRARAAQVLEISERNLYRLLKKYTAGSEPAAPPTNARET